MKFCYNTNFTLPNNPKDLDPSFKTDLDLWIVLEGKKFPSYNQRNTVMTLGLQQYITGYSKFLTLSEQMLCYICKCIRMIIYSNGHEYLSHMEI